MKNMTKTILKGVFAVALLASFSSEAFAAPVILPTSVIEITDTTAVLRGYVQNPDERSVVWFEWSDASSVAAPMSAGMREYYGDGFFYARLNGLTPGVTYSYHAVVKGAGATVYSPTLSFKTKGTTSVSSTVNSGGEPLGTGPLQNGNDTTINNSGSKSVVAEKKTAAVVTAAKEKKEVKVAPTPTDGFTNGNSAAIIGVGNGLLPTTLIGWVALLIAILVAVLIAHMIVASLENRRKERESKNLEEETETE